MSILVGGAWPYANGSLHLGHIAALLPGDIIARYYRLKGEDVLYVSGSDCNGTPISIRAKQEHTTVQAIADHYHAEFVDSFAKLGFSYDLYTRTDAQHHHENVKAIFLQLLENGYLYKKTIQQAYCITDQQFLPDRFVVGICPNCGAHARGDQCDNCGQIIDPIDLIDRKCTICGNEPEFRNTEHFYYAFSQFSQEIQQLVNQAKKEGTWRENALHLTQRYLNEGIPDRAVTRDLPNGIDVPVDGFEGKKIYVWIEAVAGYYSASLEWAKQHHTSAQAFWSEDTTAYYVHGKDNIPFHTIIWPAILMGLNNKGLPRHIISNEYLTLEKQKLSTSKNWAVWVPDFLERYHPDSLRYFLTINAPENRDADFSWREFIYSHNSELLGTFANFVNRNLKFIDQSFAGQIPQATIDSQMRNAVKSLYAIVGSLIENGQTKQALEAIFDLIRDSNRYFDAEKPWITVKDNPAACEITLATSVYIIENLSQLLEPFLPFSCVAIRNMLALPPASWQEIVTLSHQTHQTKPLYSRIPLEEIDNELAKLQQNHQ
ncbi:methionine--tRNA ligase [Kurthia sibirica]|uniref:Methionine--tRNA ligase n=1 Tax=Kurthia sibirica TaxID=202750 RepID=A0A2U3AM02_9BACL|nr:methionine--tRNA ligase [Kurthia sibirica]PWI25562.1 methionine--tRNA ligase [Kurthia sibirica]GEK33941.1 methionine--tRNA ligase 2 [Kurthia sibirica]